MKKLISYNLLYSEIIDLIISENVQYIQNLQRQYSGSFHEIEFSGVGFFVNISFEHRKKIVPGCNFDISVVHINSDVLDSGMITILFIREGKLECLEVASYGGDMLHLGDNYSLEVCYPNGLSKHDYWADRISLLANLAT
jgi:hypothetical protein